MLRIVASEDRSFVRNTSLAFMLSLVAGAVNASGLLAAGAMTSHMTGNLTRIGEGMALGSVGAFEPAFYVMFFLVGALTATLAMSALMKHGLDEPVPALLLIEAVLLAAVGLAGWFATRPLLVTELLCLSMGWQNALITKISGAIVRTTHMTGTTTDLGIELAHLVIKRPNILRDIRSLGLVPFVRSIHPESDFARATMHLTAIVCFLAGATLGPLLFIRYGYRAMLAPAAVLVAVVVANRLFPRAPKVLEGAARDSRRT
jgi:uncharacterized membrane protein YoaK (UPF0700 family)